MARKSRNGLVEAAEEVKQEKIYKAAVYVRLSVENSGKDDDGASIENQKTVCLDYLDSHSDLRLYDIYEDNGRKGTNTERPEFKRMMEDIQNGRVNCVIVKDLSRFSRDYIDAGTYLEKVFPFMGVRFISVTDYFDSLTAGGDVNSLMIPIKNMLNAAYAKDISRKIITSFRARQRKCEILPAFGPYGYLKSEEVAYRYELDPKTAPYVKMIFAWVLEGKPMCDIIRILKDLGAPSPAARKYELGIWHNEKHAKTQWNNKTITDMLRNPTYTGCIVYGRMPKNLAEGIPQYKADPSEWRVFRDMHEPLVSWEDFEKVQEILDAKSRTHVVRMREAKKRLDKIVDLFKGRLYCGDCGKKMRFLKVHSLSTDKYFRRYACGGYLDSRNQRCSRHSIGADELETAVLTAFREQQKFFEKSDALRELLRSGTNPMARSKIRSLEKHLTDIAVKRSALYEMFIEGDLDRKSYQNEKKELDTQYETLDREIWRIKKREQDKREAIVCGGAWLSVLDRYKNKRELTAELIEGIVERIDIFEEKRVVVTFKYKEERGNLERVLRDMEEEENFGEINGDNPGNESYDDPEDSQEANGEEIPEEEDLNE